MVAKLPGHGVCSDEVPRLMPPEVHKGLNILNNCFSGVSLCATTGWWETQSSKLLVARGLQGSVWWVHACTGCCCWHMLCSSCPTLTPWSSMLAQMTSAHGQKRNDHFSQHSCSHSAIASQGEAAKPKGLDCSCCALSKKWHGSSQGSTS